MKETKSLKNAIQNNIPSIDTYLTLYSDNFNQNISAAINVQCNKIDFNIEKNQMFFLSKYLETEKLKNILEEKGAKSDKIKIIEDWSEMPISFNSINIDNLIEILINSLIEEAESKIQDQKDINRLALLFSYLMRDLKNSKIDFKNIPEFTLGNIPESFLLIQEFIENFDTETESILILDTYFEIINKITKMLYLDNELREDIHYILKPKTLLEEIILASYIKRLNYLNEYNIEFDLKRIKHNKIAFVDFKDYLIFGFGVLAAAERCSLRLNVFLTQESFKKGLYPEDEMKSLRVNSILQYGEKNTPLRKFILDKGFINYYYSLKEQR